jgi:hypothetical protein
LPVSAGQERCHSGWRISRQRVPDLFLYVPVALYCPRQNSPNYIETIGISGGLFSALVHFWDGLASSKSRFDVAFSRVEVDDLSNVTLMELENLLFVQGTRPKLLRIAHRPAERGLLNAGYELSLQSPDPSAFITLYVDVTPDGFKVFSIGLVVT